MTTRLVAAARIGCVLLWSGLVWGGLAWCGLVWIGPAALAAEGGIAGDRFEAHPVRFVTAPDESFRPPFRPLTSLLDGHFPGIAVADYDDDGDLDLYLTNNGNPVTPRERLLPAAVRPPETAFANFLYRNDGDLDGDGLPDFTDVTAAAGVGDQPGIGSGALFVDLDNDGDLDLYVANKLRGASFSEFGMHIPELGVDMNGFRDAGPTPMRFLIEPDTPEGQRNGEYVVLAGPATGPATGQPRGEGRNTLFKNLLAETGEARFVDITAAAGDVGGTSGAFPGGRSSASVAAADVDGDGLLDLYVCNFIDPDFWNFKGMVDPEGRPAGDGENLFLNGQTNRLYRNDGDLTFTDVTEAAGAGGQETYLYDYSGARRPAYQPRLTDVDGRPVGEPAALTWAAAFNDFDDDGDPDLWIVNDSPGVLELLRNDSAPGQPRFTAVGRLSGVELIGQWMGIAFADLDRDADLDVFITNFGGASHTRQHNVDPTHRRLEDDTAEWHRWQVNAQLHGFFRNDGVRRVRADGEEQTIGTFPNLVQSVRLEHSRWLPPLAADPMRIAEQKRPLFGAGPLEFGWGAVAEDFDADGWSDLYWAGSLGAGQENPGRLLFGEGPFAFVDLTVEAEALNIVGARYEHVHAGRPPAPEDRILQPPGRPTNEMAGAIAAGDLDGNGFADLIIANTGGPLSRRPEVPRNAQGRPLYQAGGVRLLYNPGTGNHWLRLRLIGGMRPDTAAGSGLSNRMALGARVAVTARVDGPGAPPVTLVKELRAGESFLAQNPPELLFGLGAAAQVEAVEVRWPAGGVQRLGPLAVDRGWLIAEGAAAAEPIEDDRVESAGGPR